MADRQAKDVELTDVIIYPGKARLLRWILFIGLLFLFFAALVIGTSIGLQYFSHGNGSQFGKAIAAAVIGIPLGVFGMLFMGIWLSGLLGFLITNRPSIRINSRGIEDHCSLLAFGVGLISWNAIAAISPETITYSSRLAQNSYSFLRIKPINLEALLDANSMRSIAIRLLRMLLAQGDFIQLPEMYFSQSAIQVAQSIQAYYEQTRQQQSIHSIQFPGVPPQGQSADYSMEPLPSVQKFDQEEADREALDR